MCSSYSPSDNNLPSTPTNSLQTSFKFKQDSPTPSTMSMTGLSSIKSFKNKNINLNIDTNSSPVSPSSYYPNYKLIQIKPETNVSPTPTIFYNSSNSSTSTPLNSDKRKSLNPFLRKKKSVATDLTLNTFSSSSIQTDEEYSSFSLSYDNDFNNLSIVDLEGDNYASESKSMISPTSSQKFFHRSRSNTFNSNNTPTCFVDSIPSSPTSYWRPISPSDSGINSPKSVLEKKYKTFLKSDDFVDFSRK